MDKNTDILHEAKRLRLLAAALDLQHYTSTSANVMPIPGAGRVIAIGEPEQLRALLAADVAAEGDLPPLPRPVVSTRHGTPCYTVGQMMDYARAAIAHAVAICDGVAAKSKNSLFRSGAKICAGEIRAAQQAALLTSCAAGRDGECGHAQCPQLRDNEPHATGRHCPLDIEGSRYD